MTASSNYKSNSNNAGSDVSISNIANMLGELSAGELDNKMVTQIMEAQQQVLINLLARVEALESGTNEFPVDLVLGDLPTKYGQTSLAVPYGIPKNAKKILLYFEFQSGFSSPDTRPTFAISVNAHERVYRHQLTAHTYKQSAWSYNSDNVWMPKPVDGKVTVSTQDAYSGNAGGQIKILRYSV